MSQSSHNTAPASSQNLDRRGSISIHSLSSSSVAKSSPPVLDTLKVEASVSPTSVTSFGGDGEGSSASRSLKKIIRRSSNLSISSSPNKLSADQANNCDEDMDMIAEEQITEGTHLAPVIPFIGTVLEGHSFTQTLATPTAETIPAEEPSQVETSEHMPLQEYEQLDKNQSESDAMLVKTEHLNTSNESTREERSSLSLLTNWWSGSNQNVKSTHEKSYTLEHDYSTSTAPSTIPNSPSTAKHVELDSMDWEPSGPEVAYIQKKGLIKDRVSPRKSSSSLPSSLPSSPPSSTAFPASMIKHPKLSTSVSRRRVSSASAQGSLSSMLWSRLVVSQDNGMTTESHPVTKDATSEQSSTADFPTTTSIVDSVLDSATSNESTISPAVSIRTDSAKNDKKRWSLFGYGSKDDGTGNAPPSKLLKKGDVLIEPDSRPSSIKDAAAPATTQDLGASEEPKTPETKPTVHAGPEPQSLATITTGLAQKLDNDGPIAPALVGTSDLSVIVPPGATDSKDNVDSNAPNPSGTISSAYSWLSIIPGYSNKTENAAATPESMHTSHQVTNYKEGERRDIDGNTVNLENKSASQKSVQLEEDRSLAPKANRQTFAEIKENKGTSTVKEAGRAVASLSKVILKKKNVVLPDYYQQYPDVRQSLIAFPDDSELHAMESKHGRPVAMVKNAVSAISSMLFNKETSSIKDDSLHQGTSGIKKVVIIGVHGWFPVKLIRTVIGEPTGTSKKFCDEMNLALQDYLKLHNVELESDDVTLIPLEGEGKIMKRVEILYQNLVKNEEWTNSLRQADLVLVSTHSQGTPTSTLLVAKLINEGMLRTQESDPKMQRVGILAMAGISHGPFPSLKGNLIVRWFEADAAQELFEFMDSESEISKKYHEALKVVLTSGIRITLVASLEDQVVPLYSSIMTAVHHPSIVRAVYIDGATYQDDFLTNLISFSLRLRNSGYDDHGVLLHLSEVIAGSIYGEGHSTIYEEREVYMLAIRSLLEPPDSLTPEMARSEPIIHSFRAKQNLNPFYLPWGMRGVIDELKALGNATLDKEMERLKSLYDDWNPISKGMKEIKFRLEPVRSQLLIGHAGIGKRRLASYIRSEITSQDPNSDSISDKNHTASNTNVNFRTAESLPINEILEPPGASSLSLLRPLDTTTTSASSKSSSTRPVVESTTRYDLVLFMVDMSNRLSWEGTKRSLLQLDPGWFFGRCAIVVTRISTVSKYAFDRDDITDFVQGFYDIPTIWSNLDIDSEATLTALQVVRMLEVCTGFRRWNVDNSRVGLSRAHESLESGTESSSVTSAMSSLRLSSNSRVGSTLGFRSTATHFLLKSPEKYSVEKSAFT
ncbi:hypothetical protein BGZ46_010034 [Entomortierella lignicola]|nr:hypothetical protein BGZ46_010034 [Entomortierella lignicola]